MKQIFMIFAGLIFSGSVFGQTTTVLAPGEYKSVVIPTSSADYSRVLILLHEVYNGTLIPPNYAIGELTAIRGNTAAYNRLNVAQVNSISAYNTIPGNVTSVYNNTGPWKLKTCLYNGRKYLALDVPYTPAYHNHGYKFTGWVTSTGISMLAVTYEQNGAAVNQNLISNIVDFNANQTEMHDVQAFNVMGNVGIGTLAPQEKLSVNGKIRAHEIKVEAANWPDYVFDKSYDLSSLAEIESYINKMGHLPGIPSAAEVEKNGVDLGEMNAKLLKKIEELTLHLIQMEKQLLLQKELNRKYEALGSSKSTQK